MARVHFAHDILSPAELSAALLDGELARVGGAFAPGDALESPELRAATLRPILGDTLVAIGRSAAWVHGALGLPPDVHHVQRGPHGTTRPVRRDVRFRDTAIESADTVLLGGVRVSSRSRTLVELAREADDPVAAGAARRLASPALIREALDWIAAHRRLPGRQPAMAFLAGLASEGSAEPDQDDVTR
ncbi:hypothetical protein ACH0AH_01345 [Microbacterium paludicola]|uniref:hypothetical protein n=1 Tax=Microbacterium paludicola TaxID=300019 RepID=UPI0038797647